LTVKRKRIVIIAVKRCHFTGNIVYPNRGIVIRNNDSVLIADKIISKALRIEAACGGTDKLHGIRRLRAELLKRVLRICGKLFFGKMREFDAARAVIAA